MCSEQLLASLLLQRLATSKQVLQRLVTKQVLRWGKFSCTMFSQLHSLQGFEWFVDLFHFPFMQLLGLPCFNSVALGPPGQKVLALNLFSISTRPRVRKPPRELGSMDLSDFKAKERTKKKVLKKGKKGSFSVCSHKRF